MLEANNLGRDTHLLFAGYQRRHTAGQGKQKKIKPSFLGDGFYFYLYKRHAQTVRTNGTHRRRGEKLYRFKVIRSLADGIVGINRLEQVPRKGVRDGTEELKPFARRRVAERKSP